MDDSQIIHLPEFLEQMRNYKMKDNFYTGSTSCGTSEDSKRTDKVPILEKLNIMMEELNDKFPKIYIWRGDCFPCVKIDRPKLICSKALKESMAYIVSGVGIYAGRLAYCYLESRLVELCWSDTYIPLEEQKAYTKLGIKVINVNPEKKDAFR